MPQPASYTKKYISSNLLTNGTFENGTTGINS